jgi:O-antigen/teichoic acid export membrane protein
MLSQSLVRLPHLLLNGLSLLRFQLALFSIATLAAFGLKFALVHSLGVGGILWGTTITVSLIVVPASILRIRNWSRHASSIGPNHNHQAADWTPSRSEL